MYACTFYQNAINLNVNSDAEEFWLKEKEGYKKGEKLFVQPYIKVNFPRKTAQLFLPRQSLRDYETAGEISEEQILRKKELEILENKILEKEIIL